MELSKDENGTLAADCMKGEVGDEDCVFGMSTLRHSGRVKGEWKSE